MNKRKALQPVRSGYRARLFYDDLSLIIWLGVK